MIPHHLAGGRTQPRQAAAPHTRDERLASGIVDGQQVKDLIKRVIGLPGETVELRDGKVFIDGEELDEPYLPEGTRTDPADPSRDTFVVPDDCVFVMGDNRGASRDARYWQHPCVPEGDIVGKAFIRIWPLSVFGGI